jgi:eukaryotic-like serine/threonine-protein kinase
MNRTPVADWQQLSALYEAADALDPVALDAWLAHLREQAHPLLAQLEQMLAARAQVQHNGFLGALPPLQAPLPEPPIATWAEGSRIGPYRLVRHLGEGGMAEVWMAQRDDGAFQRTVAIKLLFRNAGSSERDGFAQRFARERDILASLDHPHIAGLHDAGVTPTGQPWLALEYVEGETLTRWCDAQRLGIEARVRLFRQVLMAVQHAHANLVIHRDLKPGNILVTAQGEVRLLDFGIAKLMEPEGGPQAESELTRLAGRPMTPQYAAPEQLLGQPLTTACDVYALGVVLYELLCGERPYELKLDSAAQLEQSILDVEPRSPSRRTVTEAAVQARGTTSVALHKALASDLDAIVLRALAKQPAQRYSSAEAFRADLDHWLAGEPVEARVPSAAYRLRKFTLRHRLAVALSAGAVLSLIGITAVAVVMGLQAREDSARAGAARDFMLGLFKRADQEKARGADITARELLETGRKDVLTRMAAQPQLQAELLQGIGMIQRDMGEHVGALSTYADAARVYEQLGKPRDATLARISEADAAMRMGDMKLAQTALQRGRDLHDRPVNDAEVNARTDEIAGWIQLAQGDAAGARDLFRRGHEQAVKAFGPYHLNVIDILRGQAMAEGRLRNFDEALRLLDQQEATAGKTSGLDTRMAPNLARDRADLLLSAGHWAQSLDRTTTALPKCSSDLGPNQSECRELMFSKVNAMLRLGMLPAADDRESLLAIADDQSSPALGADTLLLILKAESLSGSAEQQAVAFERVRTLVESEAGALVGPGFKPKALLALAEARLRANDPAGAERWVTQAVALQRRGGGSMPTSASITVAKSLQGVSLLLRGRDADALDSLRAAQGEASKSLGPNNPVTRLYSLNVALALDALGRSNEALAIVEQAEPSLRKAMREDAPAYLRVMALQRHLEQVIALKVGSSSGADPSAAGARSRPRIDFFN